jgi:hypothetical protein
MSANRPIITPEVLGYVRALADARRHGPAFAGCPFCGLGGKFIGLSCPFCCLGNSTEDSARMRRDKDVIKRMQDMWEASWDWFLEDLEKAAYPLISSAQGEGQ